MSEFACSQCTLVNESANKPCILCGCTIMICSRCLAPCNVVKWPYDCIQCSSAPSAGAVVFEAPRQQQQPRLLEFLLSRDREGFCEALVSGVGIVAIPDLGLLEALIDGSPGLFWILRCGLTCQTFCSFLCDLIGSFLEEAVSNEIIRCKTFTLAATMAQCLRLPKFRFLESSFRGLRCHPWRVIDRLERGCDSDLERVRQLAIFDRIADDGSRQTVRNIFKYYADNLIHPSTQAAREAKEEKKNQHQQQQQQQPVMLAAEELDDEFGDWPDPQGEEGDEMDDAEWEDDTPHQAAMAWEDQDSVAKPEAVIVHAMQPLPCIDNNDDDNNDDDKNHNNNNNNNNNGGEGNENNNEYKGSTGNGFPTVRRREVRFKMAGLVLLNADHKVVKSARSSEARELSDIIGMAIACAVPNMVIWGLLRHCEMNCSVEALQDVLTEVWYNTEHTTTALPCQWMTKDRINTVLKESARFFAAALKCPQIPDLFKCLCVELFRGSMEPIPFGEAFDPFMDLLAQTMLQRIAKEPSMQFAGRCSIVCEVMSERMESAPFALLWLTRSAKSLLADPAFVIKLDAFSRWFGLDESFAQCYRVGFARLPHDCEKLFNNKLLAYSRGVHERLRGTFASPEIADIVESYFRQPDLRLRAK